MPVRDIPKIVQALDNTTVSYTSSPAGDIRSGCSISSGTLIDRTKLGRGYNAVVPFATGKGNASTEANAKVTLGVHLYHGNESDGSDLAELTSSNRPSVATFLSSAMTTEYVKWTTGDKVVQSNPQVYDLKGAGRYLALGVTPTINHNATSTGTAANLLRISGGLAFLLSDEEPARGEANPWSDFSTSTSTG